MAVDCIVTVKVGKRTYRKPVAGGLPSDTPTAAEKQAAGAAAVTAIVADKGASLSYTDAEPDWGTAVAQSISWTKDANL